MRVPASGEEARAAEARIPGVLLAVEVRVCLRLELGGPDVGRIVWALIPRSPNVAFARVVPLKPGVVAGVFLEALVTEEHRPILANFCGFGCSELGSRANAITVAARVGVLDDRESGSSTVAGPPER